MMFLSWHFGCRAAEFLTNKEFMGGPNSKWRSSWQFILMVQLMSIVSSTQLSRLFIEGMKGENSKSDVDQVVAAIPFNPVNWLGSDLYCRVHQDFDVMETEGVGVVNGMHPNRKVNGNCM